MSEVAEVDGIEYVWASNGHVHALQDDIEILQSEIKLEISRRLDMAEKNARLENKNYSLKTLIKQVVSSGSKPTNMDANLWLDLNKEADKP